MNTAITSITKRAVAALAAAIIAIAAFAGTANIAMAEETHEHTYSDWHVLYPATETERGEASRICTECEEVQYTKVISPTSVKRLSGSTRYATAASVSQETFGSHTGHIVFLTTGENFPDALSASGLAGDANASIILTKSKELSSEAATEIERLKPSDIIIIGGENAVSKNIESELKTKYGENNVRRISGNTRYETANEINKWLLTRGVAIVATGDNYPDALSISSWAYWREYPIYLTSSKNGLDEATKYQLEAAGYTSIIIVGGENAVSAEDETWLTDNFKNVERIAGNDRYETSLKIANFIMDAGGFPGDLCVATGKNFPDALVGAELASRNYSVILLVDPGKETCLDFIDTYIDSIDHVFVLGGTNAVPDSIKTKIENKLGMVIDSSVDIAGATVTLPYSKYTYDGAYGKPKPTVTYGNVKLTEGTDYTVSYSYSDGGFGTTTVTVTGIGRFFGTKTATYEVVLGYGTFGDGLTWTLHHGNTNVLTIEGTGDMPDYNCTGAAPWYDYRSYIEDVEISEGITSVGESTFWTGYTKLKSVSIPSSVESIGDLAFCECSALQKVTFASNSASGSNLETIESAAFEDCTSLTSIDIPENVSYISVSAFDGCTKLTEINVESDNDSFASVDGVLYDADVETLERCPQGKTAIEIPSTVKIIGTYAFDSCTKLTSIEIPANVAKIQSSAFDGCKNLSSVMFASESALNFIGAYAFNDCSSLTAITVPKDALVDDTAFPSTCTVTRS